MDNFPLLKMSLNTLVKTGSAPSILSEHSRTLLKIDGPKNTSEPTSACKQDNGFLLAASVSGETLGEGVQNRIKESPVPTVSKQGFTSSAAHV